MRRRTVTAWFIVHRWTGLVSTAFLLMLCVTGLPLIFHAEIDAALSPAAPMRAVAPGTAPPDLDALLARALALHPGEVPLYLSFDADRPAINVTSAARADAPVAAMHFVSLDRRTGDVLPPRGGTLMEFVLRIHSDLTLGLGAGLLLGAMGLLFVAAIVSGVVLYAPFMARLRFGTVRRGRGARVTRLDRHNLIGIVTLAWGAVVGLTGTINTAAVPITALWQARELAAIGRAEPAGAGGIHASVQRALDAASRAAPGMRPQFIAFPGAAYSSTRHHALYFQGATPLTRRLLTPVFVDAATGRIDLVGRMPWYMQALLLAQPLHFGDYGGLPLKLLWAALDLLTIGVLWTGLRLWFGRRSGLARPYAEEVPRADEDAAARAGAA